MIVLRSARATAALAAACLGAAACGDGGGAARPSLAFAECRLPRLPIAAQCGTLEVPEYRSAPHGRRITLTVAVLRANTLSPRPDPLFMLAGGPGQAATFLGPFAAQMTDVRKDRDIILVDQRGTGRSSPLACRALRQDETLRTAVDLDIVPRAADCAKELAELGIDPAQYTTAAWVEDLEAVRAALGYAKINLWGGSYGTRVALEYLRRHPDRVRSAVLDGVAPPGMALSFDVWPTRDRAIDRIIESCEASPACRTAHPDLEAALGSIRTRLAAAGRDVAVTDPRTGAVETLHLTFDHVVAALQTLTYVPELAALIPEVIGRAAAGDYGPLFAAALLVTGNLTEQMNVALHYSVTCTEDAPRLSAGAARTALEGVRSQALARRAARRVRRMAARQGTPRRDDARAERRAGADPLRRTRPGDAPRKRGGSRAHAHAQPSHRGARVRPYRLVARVRPSTHRVVSRRSDLRLPARNLRQALRIERRAGAVARPAGRPMIAIDGLAKAFGRAPGSEGRRERNVHRARRRDHGIARPERRGQDDAPPDARDPHAARLGWRNDRRP